jgi:hypothetical protein
VRNQFIAAMMIISIKDEIARAKNSRVPLRKNRPLRAVQISIPISGPQIRDSGKGSAYSVLGSARFPGRSLVAECWHGGCLFHIVRNGGAETLK